MFTNGSCFFLQGLSGLWVNWVCTGPDQDQEVGTNALGVQGSTNTPNPFYQFIQKQGTQNSIDSTYSLSAPLHRQTLSKNYLYTLCPFPHLAFFFDFVQPGFTPCHSAGTALDEGPVTLCQQYFHLILLLLSEAFGSVDRFLLVETRFWLLGHHVLLVSALPPDWASALASSSSSICSVFVALPGVSFLICLYLLPRISHLIS